MKETKEYGVCNFCSSEFPSKGSQGICVVCLKAWEPEDKPYDDSAHEFKESQEAELKEKFNATKQEREDSHATWKRPEHKILGEKDARK